MPTDSSDHPLSCQKKKFVALNRRTMMRCPASMLAMRRMVSVAGRRMNVDRISMGTTRRWSAGGRLGITTLDLRSEERRVGKECMGRGGWEPWRKKRLYDENTKKMKM